MNPLSISTNVTALDAPRILNVLPNWLKIFGNHIIEILIVYDKKPTEGRINELHKASINIQPIEFYFDAILDLDKRIRIIELDYGECDYILNKWFGEKEKPLRCQAGTPIYAFIYAIDKAKSDLLLKVDCDMIFYDNGFVKESLKLLSENKIDFLEVAKTGTNNYYKFSTRAFFINKKYYYQKLPIKAHKLDIFRRVHRILNRRSVYIALEQMIQNEIEKNNLNRIILPSDLGYTMHIATIDEMNLQGISKIIELFGNGNIPEEQIKGSENFIYKYW